MEAIETYFLKMEAIETYFPKMEAIETYFLKMEAINSSANKKAFVEHPVIKGMIFTDLLFLCRIKLY